MFLAALTLLRLICTNHLYTSQFRLMKALTGI